MKGEYLKESNLSSYGSKFIRLVIIIDKKKILNFI